MSKLNNHRKQQLLYVIVDVFSAVVVWLCFLLFRWLVYDGRVFGVDTLLVPIFSFYRPLILYPLGCVIIYYLSGYYLRPLHKQYTQELKTTMISSLIIALGAFFLIIIDDETTSYHRYLVSLVVLISLQFVGCYVPRLCITSLQRRKYPVGDKCYTIHSVQDVEQFKQRQTTDPQDEVIIDLKGNAKKKDIYTIINRIYPYGVDISVAPKLYDILTGAASIREVSDTPLIRITEYKMSDSALCIKRACDVVVALFSLILLSPLYVVIAILVKCSSQGEVIYRQERVGLHGLTFNILKFRTMTQNAEPDTPCLSSEEDPRITPIGHVLRKYRLDELPQMWNVLRGDMSIVGPRPERRYFIEKIEQRAPYYCLLYKIRPGLTSWGPIKVGYTDTLDKMIQRLNYDIVYMENMSLRLDVKILFYTIGVIVDGKGR